MFFGDDQSLEGEHQHMLEAEGKFIDDLPVCTMSELLIFYTSTSQILVEGGRDLNNIMAETDNILMPEEAFYSAIRVLKAILAEIEYRIREKKYQ